MIEDMAAQNPQPKINLNMQQPHYFQHGVRKEKENPISRHRFKKTGRAFQDHHKPTHKIWPEGGNFKIIFPDGGGG